MNRYKHSKTSLFLMEIMIDILFFCILVTICLQLFFKAHNLSESTTILHRAVTACTSIAEIYQSDSNGKELILHIYPDARELDQNITIYYDEGFSSCPEERSTYCASITPVPDNDVLNTVRIEFKVTETNEVVYTLNISAYSSQTLSSLLGGDAYE